MVEEVSYSAAYDITSLQIMALHIVSYNSLKAPGGKRNIVQHDSCVMLCCIVLRFFTSRNTWSHLWLSDEHQRDGCSWHRSYSTFWTSTQKQTWRFQHGGYANTRIFMRRQTNRHMQANWWIHSQVDACTIELIIDGQAHEETGWHIGEEAAPVQPQEHKHG